MVYPRTTPCTTTLAHTARRSHANLHPPEHPLPPPSSRKPRILRPINMFHTLKITKAPTPTAQPAPSTRSINASVSSLLYRGLAERPPPVPTPLAVPSAFALRSSASATSKDIINILAATTLPTQALLYNRISDNELPLQGMSTLGVRVPQLPSARRMPRLGPHEGSAAITPSMTPAVPRSMHIHTTSQSRANGHLHVARR